MTVVGAARRRRIGIGIAGLAVALLALLALVALLARRAPEPAPRTLAPDTAASFEASSERLSQRLQDSLDERLEKQLDHLPGAMQDASEASSRLRQAERLLAELPDEPEYAGVRAALEREIAAERAALEASGVSAQR